MNKNPLPFPPIDLFLSVDVPSTCSSAISASLASTFNSLLFADNVVLLFTATLIGIFSSKSVPLKGKKKSMQLDVLSFSNGMKDRDEKLLRLKGL